MTCLQDCTPFCRKRALERRGTWEMSQLEDAERGLALTEALEIARRRGLLRECGDLDALRTAAAAFLPSEEEPWILRTWVHRPGACYVLAVVPPGRHLMPGNWHAGPVAVDGREGVAVVWVVEADMASALERSLPQRARRAAHGRRRRPRL